MTRIFRAALALALLGSMLFTAAGLARADSPSITLSPSIVPTSPTGTSVQFTATVSGVSPLDGIAVTFTVSGANPQTATVTTDSNGDAVFSYSGANAGTDLVTASATINGSTITSNMAIKSWVSCAASAPVIHLDHVANGQAFFNEVAPNGWASNTYTTLVNATYSYSPTPTFGTTAQFQVIFTKTIAGQTSRVAFSATDQLGCTTSMDPLMTSTIRDPGKPVTDSYTGIDRSESMVTVGNGAPGVTSMTIAVNGKSFRLSNLRDREQRVFSIASALSAGSNNTVTVTSLGKPGGSAALLIGPPNQ